MRSDHARHQAPAPLGGGYGLCDRGLRAHLGAALDAALVLARGRIRRQAGGDILGIACGVVAGCCFGVYTVSAKRLIQGNVNMQAAVPVTLLLGGAVLAPWTLSALPGLAAPRSLGLIAWLGPATVALAYWLYVAGLRGLTAATAGTLSLAEPLVATALGIGILHERLSLPIATGTLLLLGGLILVSISWPRVASRPETRVGPPPSSRLEFAGTGFAAWPRERGQGMSPPTVVDQTTVAERARPTPSAPAIPHPPL